MIPMQDYVYFAYLDILGYKESLSGIQIISATLMDEWREVANC